MCVERDIDPEQVVVTKTVANSLQDESASTTADPNARPKC